MDNDQCEEFSAPREKFTGKEPPARGAPTKEVHRRLCSLKKAPNMPVKEAHGRPQPLATLGFLLRATSSLGKAQKRRASWGQLPRIMS